jgi:hypothetical protein
VDKLLNPPLADNQLTYMRCKHRPARKGDLLTKKQGKTMPAMKGQSQRQGVIFEKCEAQLPVISLLAIKKMPFNHTPRANLKHARVFTAV